MRLVISQGQIIDPSQNLDKKADLYIADGKIIGIDKMPEGFQPDQVLKAQDCWVIPGIVDLYAHLKDELGSIKVHEATLAAQKGITTAFCAPDGPLTTDSLTRIERIMESDASQIDVLPIGALTQSLEGKRMADLTAMKQVGCSIFTQAQWPIQDLQLVRALYQYAASFDLKVLIFPLEPSLAKGLVHEGAVSTKLGLQGISELAETIALAQHLLLVEETGVRAHFTHITTAKGVELIREAKDKGLPITADCTMHHLHLTEVDLLEYNTQMLVSPPLRASKDLEGLRKGVKEGTLSAICSSHMPLSSIDKFAPLQEARPGMSTLDTFLSLGIHLVQEGVMPLATLIQSLTTGPLRAYDYEAKGLQLGACADVCVVNPNTYWSVSPSTLQSLGRNNPFMGWNLPGDVRYTLKKGQVIYRAPQAE